jgi:hypothetical protein
MSNVLIGIIGVILFIGLALAGALILGDDFKSSKSSTQAAKAVSDMQQIAAAYNMRRLKLGTTMSAADYSTNVAALVPRFLRIAPTVPYGGGIYTTPDINGNGAALPIHHVQARIGTIGDESARNICKEIEAQTGAADPDAAIAAVTTPTAWGARIAASRGIGCFAFTPEGGYWTFLVL